MAIGKFFPHHHTAVYLLHKGGPRPRGKWFTLSPVIPKSRTFPCVSTGRLPCENLQIIIKIDHFIQQLHIHLKNSIISVFTCHKLESLQNRFPLFHLPLSPSDPKPSLLFLHKVWAWSISGWILLCVCLMFLALNSLIFIHLSSHSNSSLKCFQLWTKTAWHSKKPMVSLKIPNQNWDSPAAMPYSSPSVCLDGVLQMSLKLPHFLEIRVFSKG